MNLRFLELSKELREERNTREAREVRKSLRFNALQYDICCKSREIGSFIFAGNELNRHKFAKGYCTRLDLSAVPLLRLPLPSEALWLPRKKRKAMILRILRQ